MGSDLLYDATHAEPLAACLARRLAKHRADCSDHKNRADINTENGIRGSSSGDGFGDGSGDRDRSGGRSNGRSGDGMSGDGGGGSDAPHSRAHIMLAVRRGELVAELACAARRRGLLVGVQALETFEVKPKESEDLSGSGVILGFMSKG